MGNSSQPQQPFTILNELQLHGLAECGASGREILAYAMLARYHDAAGTCNANAAESAAALGITARAYSSAIYHLTLRTFTDRHGLARPIIKRVSDAHRGANAAYIDALYLDSMEPAAEGDKGTRTQVPNDDKGTQIRVPNDNKGTQIRVPYDDKGTQIRVPYDDKGTQIRAERYADTRVKVRNPAYPQEYKKEMIFSAEDAAPQATRRDLAADPSTTDTGRQADRADAPAVEPPTLEEWRTLEARRQRGQLSPTDEARRAAGAARYLPASPRLTPDSEGAA